jgi:hypothetical protein
MSLTTETVAASALVFTPFRTSNNRSSYIGPAHSDLSKQQMILTSIAPKQTKSDYGNRRSTFNSVATVSVVNPLGDTVKKDMKVEINASIPSGATFADFKEQLHGLAYLAADDSMMESFFLTGKIEF